LSRILSTNYQLVMLSDIHANGPSIREVANKIPDDAVVVFLGDAVGYYDEPNFACDYLKDRANFALAGNHDRYTTGQLPYPTERDSKYRIQWTRDVLTSRNLKWLEELPTELSLKLPNPFLLRFGENIKEIRSVQLAHGAPGNCEKYVYPDSNIEFDLPDGTLALLGHTHHAMIRTTKFGVVLNPGSIGQPRDRNPASSFATIDFPTGSITHHRISYNHKEYARVLTENGFDEESISMLTRTS
jgi:predicted phosphodiesterase